jgi:hypothetical protein
MQRDRHHDIEVIARDGQGRAEIFHQRAADRLIESILVAANEAGKAPGIVLGRGTIARDGAGATILRRHRDAPGASIIRGGGRFNWSAASIAQRGREALDPSEAFGTHARIRIEAEARAARGAFGRVEEVQKLDESRHSIVRAVARCCLIEPSRDLTFLNIFLG